MIKLIAQFADNGIMILAASLLLWYYFKPEAKRLYKKKWVLAACVLLILYNVIEFGAAYREHMASRLPSRESVEKTIQKSGQIAAEDFAFSSKDGFQILVPSGYTYLSSQAGGLSLTATRDNSAFLVLKMQDPASLDMIADNTLAAMRKRNSTFKIDDRRMLVINESQAVRIECSLAKNDVPVKLVLVLVRKGNNLFQLIFSCPQELFAKMKPEYEKILTSFKIN